MDKEITLRKMCVSRRNKSVDFFSGLSLPLSDLNEMTTQGSSLGRPIEHLLKYEKKSSHNQQVFHSFI